ncbi:MAG: LLM class flavin-dependent oxidoreductase [Alphaproteobacteria bacterium]
MKFGILAQLQSPRPWPTDIHHDHKLHWEAIEEGVLAEQCGFHCFWMTEHHFYEEIGHSSAPEITLTALAMRTTRIRLGHAVVVLACNNPIRTAERAATLDIFSNGRLELGTGKGASAYHTEGFGIDMERSRDSWAEAMEVLCALFKNEKFPGHTGKYYQYPARALVPKPLQDPHPPLWTSGVSPTTFEMAARRGIGILGFATTSAAAMAPAIMKYREVQTDADPSRFFGAYPNFKVAVTVHACCDMDDHKAKAIGGAAARWYFGDNDSPLNQARLADYFDKDKFAQASKYTDETLRDNATLVAGNPDACSRTIETWQKLGVDELILVVRAGYTTHDQAMRSIELLGKQVLPRFSN